MKVNICPTQHARQKGSADLTHAQTTHPKTARPPRLSPPPLHPPLPPGPPPRVPDMFKKQSGAKPPEMPKKKSGPKPKPQPPPALTFVTAAATQKGATHKAVPPTTATITASAAPLSTRAPPALSTPLAPPAPLASILPPPSQTQSTIVHMEVLTPDPAQASHESNTVSAAPAQTEPQTAGPPLPDARGNLVQGQSVDAPPSMATTASTTRPDDAASNGGHDPNSNASQHTAILDTRPVAVYGTSLDCPSPRPLYVPTPAVAGAGAGATTALPAVVGCAHAGDASSVADTAAAVCADIPLFAAATAATTTTTIVSAPPDARIVIEVDGPATEPADDSPRRASQRLRHRSGTAPVYFEVADDGEMKEKKEKCAK